LVFCKCPNIEKAVFFKSYCFRGFFFYYYIFCILAVGKPYPFCLFLRGLKIVDPLIPCIYVKKTTFPIAYIQSALFQIFIYYFIAWVKNIVVVINHSNHYSNHSSNHSNSTVSINHPHLSYLLSS